MAFPEAVESSPRASAWRSRTRAASTAARGAPMSRCSRLMARVARFYAEALARDARARDYLTQRGLAPETIARFGLGYAVNSWNEVLRRFGAATPSASASPMPA